MKTSVFLVWAAFLATTTPFLSASAEPGRANATPPAAPSAPAESEQSWPKTAKMCADEWRADQEKMLKYNMTEESYVEQCSVADDVPALPLKRKTDDPSANPK
jgi:hypothetical protein